MKIFDVVSKLECNLENAKFVLYCLLKSAIRLALALSQAKSVARKKLKKD